MSSPTTEGLFFFFSLSPLLLLFGSQGETGINLTFTKILAQLLREAFACPLLGSAPALLSPIPPQEEAEVHGWTRHFCGRWASNLPLVKLVLLPVTPSYLLAAACRGSEGFCAHPNPLQRSFQVTPCVSHGRSCSWTSRDRWPRQKHSLCSARPQLLLPLFFSFLF